jgi:2-oxoglutarate ferredoxin oxidoreductase subunit alpha
MPVDINFMVGGEAGQGVQSVGYLLAKALARGGYHIFADQDLESRIRGGHNFFRIRAADSEVGAAVEKVDMLLALNKETIDIHRKEMAEGGVILFDSEKIKDVQSGGNLFGVPLDKLAEEKAGNKIMANTVSLGAALGIVDYDFSIIEKVLKEYFGTDDKGESNVKAARAGYDFVKENFHSDFKFQLGSIDDGKQMVLTGNDAVALGAMAAGCKFLAAYPMTPTTPIMEYMAARAKDYNMVVVQPEDEIAAVNMAIGAGFAGVRAMTATSGSGFCLMVEGLGLAGITETPLVIILGQRPGPAVGLPTRTEQGDLQFVLTAHQGEFPRAVLAPATIEDAFWMTVKAFNLAEKYQIPVLVLTDHYSATAYSTVSPFDLSKVTIERGDLFSADKDKPEEYKRHKVTDSGVSPRAFPGLSKTLVVTDADEHDETGHLTEVADIRSTQDEKRLRKMVPLSKEIAPPHRFGPPNADVTLLGWGSTYGAIHEAVAILNRENQKVNMLHFSELWPFPAEAVMTALQNSKRTMAVENNATGQLARLIRAETGRLVDGKILKYDGRPITPAFIIDKFRKGVG